MVGGGRGAFIGSVHRMAAALDGQIELVCGAFSSDPLRSIQSGEDFFLDSRRCYGTYEEMFRTEATLEDDVRMDMVSIVTPNHLHFAPAMMALDFGFHVICDKPLCLTVKEAETLATKVKSTGLIFAVTHAYAAYPMIKQARQMIAHAALGKIRRVVVEYPQGWLSTPLESDHQKQAAWRTDPEKSGAAGAMGDIGTHAAQLAEYVSGLRITQLCADLHTHVAGRRLDDDGSVLLRFNNGARGVLYASQISAGEENNLRIRVYGELGSIEWAQMEPNSLIVRWLDQPMQVYRTGVGPLYPSTIAHTRVPSGHPEGYIEAFANIYRNVAFSLQSRLSGKSLDPIYEDYPGIDDGVRGMKFIEAALNSNLTEEKWTSLQD